MSVIDNEYDIDAIIDNALEGVVQIIRLEMDKKGISIRALSDISGIEYSHISRILDGRAKIGLIAAIKLAYALDINPSDLFPDDVNKRKTNGQRFEEITNDLDVSSTNYLLSMCTDYSKEWHRIKENLKGKK